MFATTRQFLDYFSLKTLDQLPALAEIRDLETLNAELGFSDPLPGTDAAPAPQGDPDTDGEPTAQAQQVAAEPGEAEHAISESGVEDGEVLQADSGQQEATQSGPGLTVVGGTAHVVAARDEPVPSVTLAEAADDLEARAAQSESADVSAADNDEVESASDDYTDGVSSESESKT